MCVGDLWLVGARRIVEYDGGDHLTKRVHQRDVLRDKVVMRADWERYPYLAHEIVHTAGGVLRATPRRRSGCRTTVD